MLNKVILIGRLGGDPEIKTTQHGDKVANFTLATSERWKNAQGEKQERTEWHKIIVWNEGLIKVIEQYVKKGSKLYIEGQLQTRKWQDQHGKDHYSTEVVLKAFRGQLLLLGDKSDSSSNQSTQSTTTSEDYAAASGSYRSNVAQSSHQRPLDDEADIPF